MISEQEAIELLNQSSTNDLIAVNQGLTNEVLVAQTEQDSGDGNELEQHQKDELIEYLNSVSWNNDLTINDHLNGVTIAGKHPCD